MGSYSADSQAFLIIKTLILDHFGENEDEECAEELIEHIFKTLEDNGIVFALEDNIYYHDD